MTKLLALIAATFLVLAALSSGADAGFNIRLKVPTDFSVLHKVGCACDCHDEDDEDTNFDAYRKRSNQSVSRRQTPTIEAARAKVAKPVAKANAESKRANETVETAQLSIATAHDQVDPDAGCKNYFASAGMTQSVACEK